MELFLIWHLKKKKSHFALFRYQDTTEMFIFEG